MEHDELIAIANSCPNLTWFSPSDSRKLTNKSIQLLAEKCTNLEHFEIPYYNHITDSSVCYIAQHCFKLSRVILRHMTVSNALLLAIGKHCPLLTEFTVTPSEHGMANVSLITDKGVCALVRGCLLLQKLILMNTQRITDKSLHAIATYSHKLRSLHISEAYNITDAGVTAIFAQCLVLSIFIFPGVTITESALRILCEHGSGQGHKLEVKIQKYSDTDTAYIITHGTNITLHIKGDFMEYASFVAVLQQFPSLLKDLSIANCTEITDSIVSTIVANNATSIQKCNFNNCTQLTRHSVLEISEKCHSLRAFIVACINDLIDSDVTVLVTNNPQLTELTVKNCVKITDVALFSIAQQSKQLRQICLSDSPKITDNGVISAVHNCLKITHIMFDNCKKLTGGIFTAFYESRNVKRSVEIVSVRGCPKVIKKSCTAFVASGIVKSEFTSNHVNFSKDD